MVDVADELLLDVVLGPNLVVEVFAVEGRLESLGLLHLQVLANVLLHLGRSRGREGNNWQIADVVDDAVNAAVLGPEVVAPL